MENRIKGIFDKLEKDIKELEQNVLLKTVDEVVDNIENYYVEGYHEEKGEFYFWGYNDIKDYIGDIAFEEEIVYPRVVQEFGEDKLEEIYKREDFRRHIKEFVEKLNTKKVAYEVVDTVKELEGIN